MPVTIAPSIAMTSDVDSVVEQLGVRAELPAVLSMTRRVFPETTISVEIDDDPEIAHEFHLVIVVSLARYNGHDDADTYYRWHRELSDACPALLKHVFRLSVEFDE